MVKFISYLLFPLCFLNCISSFAQSDSLILKDLSWDNNSPAGSTELFIPSGGSLLAGFIYRANGSQKHPTLLLLHGYPGNERNLDMAQIVRGHGWNVIYFDYRGSWASQGKFSFKNSVEDVSNVVAFCNKYQDSLKIDTSQIVLFGHSMGGWICLKALAALPQIHKGFALSTWDIYNDFKSIKDEPALVKLLANPDVGTGYFVLNSTTREIYTPVIKDPAYYNLENDAAKLSGKQIIMLDEHQRNETLSSTLRAANHAYFDYQVWPTDHSFTNKRVSLMNRVLWFIEK